MKNIDKLLQYLPLAYLFLVILGILKESLFYFHLNVSIMNYTSIVDVIMSPIAELTSNISVIIGCFSYILLTYIFITFVKKNNDKKWNYKFTGDKNMSEYTESVKNEKYVILFINYLAFGFIGYFIAFGYMNGKKVADSMANNTLQYEDQLYMNSGVEKKCHILGLNSQYYFIVNKTNQIEIVPLGSVSSLINKPDKKTKK